MNDIKTYKKRPVPVQAIQWTGINDNEIKEFCREHVYFKRENNSSQCSLFLKTLEGDMHATIGDYIIKGIHGEFYPCKKDIFEETYVENNDDDCKSDEYPEIITIDDAIKHCEDIVNDSTTGANCSKQHKQLAEWLSELKELRSKYQYMMADIQNLKRRHEQEKIRFLNLANKDIILDLLPIVDAFDVAMTHLPENGSIVDCDTFYGFKLLKDKLEKLLENEGCEKIATKVGDRFDVKYHEAISSIDSDDESGTIVNIFQDGYVLNGTLLRATKVGVAK